MIGIEILHRHGCHFLEKVGGPQCLLFAHCLYSGVIISFAVLDSIRWVNFIKQYAYPSQAFDGLVQSCWQTLATRSGERMRQNSSSPQNVNQLA